MLLRDALQSDVVPEWSKRVISCQRYDVRLDWRIQSVDWDLPTNGSLSTLGPNLMAIDKSHRATADTF
jgi:hypothetical protein